MVEVVPGTAAPQPMMMMAPAPAGDIFGNRLEIVQNLALMEMCGCEMKNTYRVEGAAAGPMYLRESSGCIERIYCGPMRRADFYLHMGYDAKGPVVAKFQKKFHCSPQGPCACIGIFGQICWRPEMNVLDANGGKIGSVYDPCRFCWMDQTAYDAAGTAIFNASACPCQIGMFCPCFGDVRFPVTNKVTGDTDGEIKKTFNGCSELCLDVNRFVIQFPSNTDINHKTLLFGMGVLIDFQYFEKHKQKQQG
jgi:hypothetical protein